MGTRTVGCGSWLSALPLPFLEHAYACPGPLALLQAGTLPAEWGSASAFQQLTALDLEFNGLSGLLPGSWGSADGPPKLEQLNLTGKPACRCFGGVS